MASGCDVFLLRSVDAICFGPPCTSVILLKVKEEYDCSSGRNGTPELVTSMMRADCRARGRGQTQTWVAYLSSRRVIEKTQINSAQ